MSELKPEMLPDQTPDSTQTASASVSPDVNSQADAGPADDAPADSVPSGHVPYSRFKEEVKKRKDLEEKLKSLEASSPSDEEDTVSSPDVSHLEKKVRELELDKFILQYPELADKREELDEFLEENAGLSLERAVTLFRAEHGLIGTPGQSRKGLEKVVAGPKTAPPPRWTLEDIENLRLNQPKKWLKLNQEGAFEEAVKWQG